jgi:hypothetical protein
MKVATLLFTAIALALLASPIAGDAQTPGKTYRIGFLSTGASAEPFVKAM